LNGEKCQEERFPGFFPFYLRSCFIRLMGAAVGVSSGVTGGRSVFTSAAALEVTRPGDSERKKRHLQSLTSYIRQYHPESRTLLCSGQPSFADDRKSSCAECIVAALLIIKGFISVVKLILPGRYPKGTKLHWVVQGGCSGCPLLQSFSCHLLGQDETKSSFKFFPLKRLTCSNQGDYTAGIKVDKGWAIY
jgi:hypothetical protein